jgi:hypothetical protein
VPEFFRWRDIRLSALLGKLPVQLTNEAAPVRSFCTTPQLLSPSRLSPPQHQQTVVRPIAVVLSQRPALVAPETPELPCRGRGRESAWKNWMIATGRFAAGFGRRPARRRLGLRRVNIVRIQIARRDPPVSSIAASRYGRGCVSRRRGWRWRDAVGTGRSHFPILPDEPRHATACVPSARCRDDQRSIARRLISWAGSFDQVNGRRKREMRPRSQVAFARQSAASQVCRHQSPRPVTDLVA